MKTIWKYELNFTEIQAIEMPDGAEILTVQTQRDVPMLWAMVDPEAPKVTRHIRTICTGQEFQKPVNLRYIGTSQICEGRLVYHVFVIMP